jgi:ATP-dependent Zn protease
VLGVQLLVGLCPEVVEEISEVVRRVVAGALRLSEVVVVKETSEVAVHLGAIPCAAAVPYAAAVEAVFSLRTSRPSS